MREQLEKIFERYNSLEISEGQAIDKILQVTTNSSQQDDRSNLIIDTRVDRFIKDFMGNLRVWFGVEQFRFSKNSIGFGSQKQEIHFWYKKFNEKEEQPAYFEIVMCDSLKHEYTCSNCGPRTYKLPITMVISMILNLIRLSRVSLVIYMRPALPVVLMYRVRKRIGLII